MDILDIFWTFFLKPPQLFMGYFSSLSHSCDSTSLFWQLLAPEAGPLWVKLWIRTFFMQYEMFRTLHEMTCFVKTTCQL